MAVFVLIHPWREFPLSVIANHFELSCQLKQLLLLFCKICPYLQDQRRAEKLGDIGFKTMD